MTAILGLAGSLRGGSRNAALLREATELAPAGSEIRIGSIDGIPLYNADVQQAHGFPGPVIELKRQLRAADGLLLVTPEYNNSIPGVFKNAIDWASRPADEIPEVFGDLPVAVAGAGGRSGTRLAQSAWLPVFRTLGMRHWSARTLYLDRSWERFDDQGRLVDDEDRQRLARLVREFAAHCGELPRSGPNA